MACGKTKIGRKLSKKLGYDWIDLDDYIADKQKMSIKKMFHIIGEQSFRMLETIYLAEATEHVKKNTIISLGGGTIRSQAAINYIREKGTVIYLKRPLTWLIERLMKTKKRKTRPLLPAKKHIPQVVAALFKKREPFYEQAHIIAETDSVKKIIYLLNAYKQ